MNATTTPIGQLFETLMASALGLSSIAVIACVVGQIAGLV